MPSDVDFVGNGTFLAMVLRRFLPEKAVPRNAHSQSIWRFNRKPSACCQLFRPHWFVIWCLLSKKPALSVAFRGNDRELRVVLLNRCIRPCLASRALVYVDVRGRSNNSRRKQHAAIRCRWTPGWFVGDVVCEACRLGWCYIVRCIGNFQTNFASICVLPSQAKATTPVLSGS